MHNKKVLIDALKKLGSAKAPSNKKDIIVDPNGQWAHPGEITRIPSNTITMQGVPYPVLAKPNVGQPQMMYPGQNYQFPDADYVDEFPMNEQPLAKKSMGGLTRFSGSAGRMMGLPPIMSTVGNAAPKITSAVNTIPKVIPKLHPSVLDSLRYPAFDVLTGESTIGTPTELTKYLGDFDFKQWSDGWETTNAMMNAFDGPQWMPSKEDFYTDKEVANLVDQQIAYRNAWDQFEDMYPEEPGMNIMNALSGDTSRDEQFANLFPGVYMPNFRMKILSPEQSQWLTEAGLSNPTFVNKGMLNKSSLKGLTKGEDVLPNSYKRYLEAYNPNGFLYTADPKIVVGEMRGSLGLKLSDIQNATPEQLEFWRRKVIKQAREQALKQWESEMSNNIFGADAYEQLMKRPGARNKDGGAVRKEGGESPKEFVSAKEGVDTPIYKQVSVKPSKIQGKGLFTNESIRAGEPIGISHIRKVFNRNGESYQAPFPSTVLGYYNHSEEPNVREVDNGDHIVMVATRDIKPNEELTSNYDISGIQDLETSDNFKKGGSIPKLPKKKNARAYSRSLEATNRLLAEHPFFAQPKSRKNKIYDPNSQYFQDGGEPGDKFKKRLMKRYPGMQDVYGSEGENLSIVKDPNYDARSAGYGDIEFAFPGDDPVLNYPNLVEKGGPDYNYPNPSPDKYTALYNPRGANRGDVFLDMMHGMRDDPNYQPLLQNFEKAVKDARGEDMTWQYEGEVENGSTQSRDRFDENYVDGQLRAELAPGSIGMFSKGRKDYRQERKYDSPEMRAAAEDIRNYLKGEYEDGGELDTYPRGGGLGKGKGKGKDKDKGKESTKFKPKGNVAPFVTSDPEEYAYRKAAYDDSLHVANKYNSIMPKPQSRNTYYYPFTNTPYLTINPRKTRTTIEKDKSVGIDRLNEGAYSRAWEDFMYNQIMQDKKLYPDVENYPTAWETKSNYFPQHIAGFFGDSEEGTWHSDTRPRYQPPRQKIIFQEPPKPSKPPVKKSKVIQQKPVVNPEVIQPTPTPQPIPIPIPQPVPTPVIVNPELEKFIEERKPEPPGPPPGIGADVMPMYDETDIESGTTGPGGHWEDKYSRYVDWDGNSIAFNGIRFRKPGHGGDLIRKGKRHYIHYPSIEKRYDAWIEPDELPEEEFAMGGEYLELDLTPEEIQEYAKGGYIIEDISVPQLTKAANGKVVKGLTSAIDDVSNIINGASKASTLQKVVNRAITPVGYNFPAKLVAAPLTFAFPHKPETTSLQNRYDAWNVYNQMAPKYDSFTMNTDGTVSIKNFQLPKKLLDEVVNSKRNAFETAEFNDSILAGEPLNFGGVHGNGNIIKGVDEEGKSYIDFVDTWDLQPLQNKSFLPNNVKDFEFGQLVGSKPFDLRNRIYYDNDGNYFDQNGQALLENEIETPDLHYIKLAHQIGKNAQAGIYDNLNYTTSKKKFLSTKDYTNDDEDWGHAIAKSKLNAFLGMGIGLGAAAAYEYDKSKNKMIVTDPNTGKYIEVDKDKWLKENKSLYKKDGGELPKANLGKIVKTSGNALSKISKAPTSSGWVRGTTTLVPRVPPTKLNLGSIPADFPANVTFPLDIYNKDNSGYLTLYPNPKVKGVDDNTWHFLAKMPNAMEAGRAFQLMNQAVTKPNPSILEPYSLSLDSYNMLLNMGKRPDWEIAYENHIPLNYLSVNHNLFEGLEVPRGIRTGRPLKQETADEMVKRLNDMLLQKGMTEQARVFNVPGGPLKEIQVPNYRLTRQYAKGGFLPKAANGLPVNLSQLINAGANLEYGPLARAGLYKAMNPAGYEILSKVKGIPSELYKNTFSNETRPFRVGMSLKYGHQPHLETFLKTKKIPLEEFMKMPDKDRMQVFDQSTLGKLNDIGQRRLDAWAVGLGLPQEYGTLEQIGDNKFRMLNTAYSPDYFNDLYNDLRASGYEQSLSFGHNPLEDLTREHYRTRMQGTYSNEQDLNDMMIRQDAMRIGGWNPWVRSRHAKLNALQPFSGISTGKVWDNDQFGVMGGYSWDINDHPQGLQFKTNDIWDLNPWEKRGHAYLNPSDTAKQISASSFFKPLQNVEALTLVGGKPFLIENNFVVDPKTYKTLDNWEEGGNVDYTLGDEVDEATMRELEKLGYTFEKI